MAAKFAAATAVFLSCLLALAALASCNTEGKLHVYDVASIVSMLSLFPEHCVYIIQSFFSETYACLLLWLQGDILYKQRATWKDPNDVLVSWDPTLANPCTWLHITCNNDNSVIRVYVPLSFNFIDNGTETAS